MQPKLTDILKIPLNERMEWVEAIWDSIALENAKNTALTNDEIKMIDERLEALEQADKFYTWEEVKANARAGR